MEKILYTKHIEALHRSGLTGANSLEDLRALFSHLLLNLPQEFTTSIPAATGGRK